MRNILEISSEVFSLARLYLISFYGGLKNRKLFEDVETYCMFIGYPRSGHTLIGSLLDAHPNMIIAHELDALKYLSAGFSRRQIYYLLLNNSQAFTKAGREWTGYSYRVPNQWQGRFKKLQVIGDKKGGGSALRLHSNPEFLQRLRDTFGKVKFIHVLRNPYDSINPGSRRRQKPKKRDIRNRIERYFSRYEGVAEIKEKIKSTDIFEFRIESFIDNPKSILKELCHFLGTDASSGYLNDCASIVFKSPRKGRYDTQQWSSELIELVKKNIDQIPFLYGYSYED